MDISYIHTLLRYDTWANQRTLDATAKLTGEQFTKDLGNSFPSVRDTLVHILSAQATWLSRWRAASPKQHLNPNDFPDITAVRARAASLASQLDVFFDSLDQSKLNRPLPYHTFAGQPQAQLLWQQIAHLMNHSTYHRGQLTAMLRQLGAQPIATDLIAFFREASPD